MISNQDLEQIFIQAMSEKCNIIAKNQIKHFTGKAESAVNYLKTMHEEAINKYSDKFIDKYSIEIQKFHSVEDIADFKEFTQAQFDESAKKLGEKCANLIPSQVREQL